MRTTRTVFRVRSALNGDVVDETDYPSWAEAASSVLEQLQLEIVQVDLGEDGDEL